MKRASAILGTLLILAVLPSTALADFHRNRSKGKDCYNNNHAFYGSRPTYYPRFNGQGPRNNFYGNANYNQALNQGIRSGALSWREVRELREDQQDIREKAAAYRSDGYLSPRERASLRDDVREFRDDLNHELYDGERRNRW